VSQPKPVTMLARWNNPASLTSRRDWLKPAPAAAMVASIVVAVAALYRPNPRWPVRNDCQLQVSAAADRPRNTGTAVSVCAVPVRLGRTSASGCSWRVAANRISGEDGGADQAGTRCADQGLPHPRAERSVTGPPQTRGPGEE
jgi:hypothetical protein